MSTEPDVRRKPSLAAMIVWVLFCFVMWSWAILGSIIVLLGIVSLYGNPPLVDVELGATPDEKLHNLCTAAGVAAVGLAFVSLRLLGHLHFGARD
jgi:hypothetical protein